MDDRKAEVLLRVGLNIIPSKYFHGARKHLKLGMAKKPL
jgi:hypothetical protein